MAMKKRNKRSKKRKTLFICLFFLFFLFLGSLICSTGPIKNTTKSTPVHNNFFPDDYGFFIDKVYTFHSAQPQISLTNLSFQAKYIYYFKLGQVSDNTECEMKVDLIDPMGDIYHVFESEEPMRYDEYYEIPFGAALTGVYTLNFTKLSGPNVNIHIVISQGDLCCREFVSGDTNLVYEVKKIEYISYGKSYKPYWALKDQWRYHGYICRVSPITYNRSIDIRMDHNIVDPSNESVSFAMYSNTSLGKVWEPLEYSFGTAMAGDYLFNFTFHQDVSVMNVMILITDEGRLATGEDEGPTNTTDTEPGIHISIPLEAQVGIGLGVGGLALVGLIVLFYIKRSSNV